MNPKRQLFTELMEGIEAMQAHREGHLQVSTITKTQLSRVGNRFIVAHHEENWMVGPINTCPPYLAYLNR
jgi:hypothetical protein